MAVAGSLKPESGDRITNFALKVGDVTEVLLIISTYHN